MPDASKVQNLIHRAAEYAEGARGRRGSTLWLEDAEEIFICGDLHGNIPAFRQLLIETGLKANPGRHLVLQELVHGDLTYPKDGGDRSHQLVDVVAALKCEFPDRVHLLLGNHELSELTGRSISKAGMPLNAHFRRGVETAYGEHAGAIIDAYHRLFRAMFLAIRTPNRVFMCHTIPDGNRIENFDVSVLEASTWTPEAMGRGGSVYALTWGRDTRAETADQFAQMVDADLFITGHQPCDEGFLRANDRQLIIDGTPPLPCYCRFPSNGPIDIDRLVEGVRPLSI